MFFFYIFLLSYSSLTLLPSYPLTLLPSYPLTLLPSNPLTFLLLYIYTYTYIYIHIHIHIYTYCLKSSFQLLTGGKCCISTGGNDGSVMVWDCALNEEQTNTHDKFR